MRPKREHATHNQQTYMATTSNRDNAMRGHLCDRAEGYPYSSAYAGFELDGVPQGLKPKSMGTAGGAPEGVPFQSKAIARESNDALRQGSVIDLSPDNLKKREATSAHATHAKNKIA
ncbi:MAG: hypothetical protein WB952_19700 [Terriglobales bacterium]